MNIAKSIIIVTIGLCLFSTDLFSRGYKRVVFAGGGSVQLHDMDDNGTWDYAVYFDSSGNFEGVSRWNGNDWEPMKRNQTNVLQDIKINTYENSIIIESTLNENVEIYNMKGQVINSKKSIV